MTWRSDRTVARRAAGVIAAALLCGVPLRPAVADDAAICFHVDDRPTPAIEVYQQAPPPAAARSIASPYYPATAYASQNLDSLWKAAPGPAKYYFQWANRSNAELRSPGGRPIPRKPNFQPAGGGPSKNRTAFTSVDKANACTLAQTAAVLGLAPAKTRQMATSAGLTLAQADDADRSGIAEAEDVCVVQNRPMPADAAGVVLDYEVQDGRTAAQTLQFLTQYADLVHAAHRKAILLTNPLDAPTQAYTGVSAQNAGRLAGAFDRMTLLIWSRNAQGDVQASFDKQLEIVNQAGPVDPKRLLVVFELDGTSLDDARATRQLMLKHGLAGVMFWRNGAKQGGECATPVNRKIACLAMGRCAASPIADR
jgi:hypothetical protein